MGTQEYKIPEFSDKPLSSYKIRKLNRFYRYLDFELQTSIEDIRSNGNIFPDNASLSTIIRTVINENVPYIVKNLGEKEVERRTGFSHFVNPPSEDNNYTVITPAYAFTLHTLFHKLPKEEQQTLLIKYSLQTIINTSLRLFINLNHNLYS